MKIEIPLKQFINPAKIAKYYIDLKKSEFIVLQVPYDTDVDRLLEEFSKEFPNAKINAVYNDKLSNSIIVLVDEPIWWRT